MKEFIFVINDTIVVHIRTITKDDAIRRFEKQYGKIDYHLIEAKKK